MGRKGFRVASYTSSYVAFRDGENGMKIEMGVSLRCLE
jgi:hypothetical protein